MRIDVVLNLDDGYTQHCAATLASLFANNSGIRLHIHLITTGICATNKLILKEFIEGRGQFVSFYTVDPARVESLPGVMDKGYISPAAYLRLFMHELLPGGMEKALYLDCDLLVRGSIKELWETDVEGYALAAAEDAPGTGSQERLGYDKKYFYFNSGVMLVNLKYWRENHAEKLFPDFIRDHRESIILHDQDVLNGVFHALVKRLEVKWNVMDCYYNDRPNVSEANREGFRLCAEDPMIMHFAGMPKPWHVRIYKPFQDEYYSYLEQTPWKGYRPGWRSTVRHRGFWRALSIYADLEKISYRSKIKPKNRLK